MKSENPPINQILDTYKPIWSISHAISLMGWDFETYTLGTFIYPIYYSCKQPAKFMNRLNYKYL
ncbi:MAG: hypothetical protein E6K85_00510 [Thaumarchaeota archaeon]|nr:MAG: hypothetical protein E6K85_00510 [Nitrososphaerota archaeon]